MNKRERIYNKYGGRCAYTGQPLGDDWQIDHKEPRVYSSHWPERWGAKPDFEGDDNLVPCCRIINHYKHSANVEGFRDMIATLQGRINSLKKKNGEFGYQWKRGEYLQRVADLFGITEDKPFSGKFYFEKLIQEFPEGLK
jgi:hypothetical protein